jgi:aspartokinase
MIVMKFGGTSVADSEAIARTISIIGGRLDRKPIVVVSALSKVTDLLYKIADSASEGDRKAADEYIETLQSRHITLGGEPHAGRSQDEGGGHLLRTEEFRGGDLRFGGTD